MKENPEGNWVAAEDCDAQSLRADTAEAELKATKEGMAYRGSLFGKVQSERDDYERKLAAAEQRIAKMAKALEEASYVLGCYAPPTHKVLDLISAALNPDPEAESHE